MWTVVIMVIMPLGQLAGPYATRRGADGEVVVHLNVVNVRCPVRGEQRGTRRYLRFRSEVTAGGLGVKNDDVSPIYWCGVRGWLALTRDHGMKSRIKLFL